jgi:hypothetical protein
MLRKWTHQVSHWSMEEHTGRLVAGVRRDGRRR